MCRKRLLIALQLAVFILSFCLISTQAQQRLSRPRNLRVNGDKLSWDAVTNASGYHVRWRTSNRYAWQYAPVSPGQTSYRFIGLAYDVDYTVDVRALAGTVEGYSDSHWRRAGNSIRLAAPTATPTATPTNTPTDTATPKPENLRAPRNLRLVSERAVAWDAVEGASGYDLRWETPNGEQETATVTAAQTQYTFANLSVGLTYKVRVRALGDGQSYESRGKWSRALRVTLPTATPTNTPTATSTNTPTDTPTNTPTATATNTPAATFTPTATATATYYKYESRQETESTIESCTRDGKAADCTYERICGWYCEITERGGECVEDRASRGCHEWELVDVAYHPTATPVPSDTPVATDTPTVTNTPVPPPTKKKQEECRTREETRTENRSQSGTVDGCPATIHSSQKCYSKVRVSGQCDSDDLRGRCDDWRQTRVDKNCPAPIQYETRDIYGQPQTGGGYSQGEAHSRARLLANQNPAKCPGGWNPIPGHTWIDFGPIVWNGDPINLYTQEATPGIKCRRPT